MGVLTTFVRVTLHTIPTLGRMPTFAIALWTATLLGACEDAVPGVSGGDAPPALDAARGDGPASDARDGAASCGGARCRGDELCVGEQCVPWGSAPLEVDFEVLPDPARTRRVLLRVRPGGFPRERAEEIRFALGDGASGFGEAIAHEYAAPGVYPVDLEVRLEGYRVLRRSHLAILSGPDGPPPPRVELTVDELPAYLSGIQPYRSDNRTPRDPSDDYSAPFSLLLPRSGFSVDVTILEAQQGAIDRSSLSLTADVPLGEGAIPAGTELAPRLVFDTTAEGVPRARWLVSAAERFPKGPVTLRLVAPGAAGEHREALSFETVDLGARRDPFARPVRWLFRFDLDLFTGVAGADGAVIAVRRGPNGVADFTEELERLGAQGLESGPGAREVRGRGVVGANAVYRQWVITRIVTEVYRIYRMAPDGAPRDDFALSITHDGAPGAPDPAAFSPTGEVSMMRFGGTFPDALGYSDVSPHARERVDDTGPDRGVATAGILDALARTPIVSEELAPIRPGDGVPVGEHAQDGLVLGDAFDRHGPANTEAANRRFDDLARIARYLGLAIATVTAHEMGHAMGLVPNGAPPEGFFGDRADVDFMGDELTNSFHADYPPVNLMQAGGNLGAIVAAGARWIELPEEYGLVDLAMAIALETRLSPYELAYFRRRLTYGRSVD